MQDSVTSNIEILKIFTQLKKRLLNSRLDLMLNNISENFLSNFLYERTYKSFDRECALLFFQIIYKQ